MTRFLVIFTAVLPFTAWAQRSPGLPGVAIAYSPASTGKYIGSPGLVKLANGTLVASHDEFGPGSSQNSLAATRIYRSTDAGATWTQSAAINGAFWSNLFVHRGALYLMGTTHQYGNAVIRRSLDGGTTWTTPESAATGLLAVDGQYHCAPMTVVEHGGRLWRAMERRIPASGWAPNFSAGMMSVPAGSDLLDASQWTFSNFLPSQKTWLDGKFGGWLEGNALVDPAGNLINMLRVDHPGYPERTALLQVSADGTTLAFDPATGFAEMPGGAKKFAIRRDPQDGRYWSLVNGVPAAFQTAVSPGSIRNKLSLVSSGNLRDWTDHGTVLSHPDPARHGFQYVEWQFDGDDLIAAIRTGFDDAAGGAADYHNANYLSFHRISNFRDFAGGLLPGSWQHARFGHDGVSPSADEDGDGFSNRHEYMAGSNPRRAGSTPPKMGSSALVALASATGVDLYRVRPTGSWTFERQLTATSYQSLLVYDGKLYGAGFNRIDRIDLSSGAAVTLATRNTGAALAAGWTTADTQQLAAGPDGKLYFSTAFGAAAGQGVFRVAADGSGFERFIARSGGAGAEAWDLNNARGLAWLGDRVFVSSRAGTTSTGRPVHEFDAAGNFVRVARSDLRAPQGLIGDGSDLLVAGYNGTLTALASGGTAPGELRSVVSGLPSMICMGALELFGEMHVVTFQHGIWRQRDSAALEQAFKPATTQHAGMAILPETDPYGAWITGFPDLAQNGKMDDPDGDGVPNLLEFLLGWNPGDGSSRFQAKIERQLSGSFTLSWPSGSDTVFTVRSSADLNSWPGVEAVVTGSGPLASMDLPAVPAGTTRFFRVEWTQ